MAKDEASGSTPHVQVQFFSSDNRVLSLPDAPFAVPRSTNCDNLNALVNKGIRAQSGEWTDQRFEFLVGESFLRTTLNDFIEEYGVNTELVIRVECVLSEPSPIPKHDLTAPDWISSVNIVNDVLIATTYDGKVCAWSANKGVNLGEEQLQEGAVKCCSIFRGPKSLEIVSGGEEQTLVRAGIVTDGGHLRLSPTVIFRGHTRSVECVAVDASGTRCVSGAFDSLLKVWNLEVDDTMTNFEKPSAKEPKKKKKEEELITKTPMVTLAGHRDAVVGVCWTDASHVISASWDHSLAIWDLELAGETARLRGQRAYTSIDVSKASRPLVITGSADPIPRLYDPRSTEGSLVKQSFIGHTGWVSAVSWNPKNENSFISASFDGSVRMWDIRSSKTSLYDLGGHEGRVLAARWTPSSIVSGGADATVKVFAT